MKLNRVMKHSVRLISIGLLSLFFFGCNGGAQEKPVVIDYAAQPEEFVVKLEPNKRYTIVRGQDQFPFSLMLKKGLTGDYGKCRLIWNKIDREADMLRAQYRIPYLIRANGKDYLYIYGNQYGDLNFLELGEKYVAASDNTMLHFYEEPKDPKQLPVRIGIHVLGPAAAELRYHVGKRGAPAPNDPEGYRYCTAADAKQKFVTTKASTVLLFASRDAGEEEGKKVILPAGSMFTRLRCSGRENTDLLLEDGRVFRVKERYLFGEPEAVMDVRDLADNKFEYKEVEG